MRASLDSLSCSFFSFITSNISCCFFLACRVPAEKSVGNLGISLYVVTFPLLLLIFFSLVFNSGQFPYSMSWHVPPCFYLAWDSLPFLYLGDHFLSHFMEISSYYLLQYFLKKFLSLFPSRTPYNVNVDVFDIVLEFS